MTSADKREYYTLESFGKFSSSEKQNDYDFLVAIDITIKNLIISMGKAIDPNRFGAISSYLQKFDSYSQKGDTSSAFKTIKEAYDKFPEDIGILGQLINCYIRAGKAEESIIYLDKAIAMEKDNSSVIVISSYYLAKGQAFEKMGKQDEAIKEYEAAIKVKADYLGAYWNIAVIYYNRGDRQNDDNEFAKAIPYFEKALECDPNNADVKTVLRNVYSRLKMMDKLKKIK